MNTLPEMVELAKLAHATAYDDCCVSIESNTLSYGGWFDVANGVFLMNREYVDTALRYLDMRGLIERDPSRPGFIGIRDESEDPASDLIPVLERTIELLAEDLTNPGLSSKWTHTGKAVDARMEAFRRAFEEFGSNAK